MNKAVLVVEDEPLIAHMVSECLADAGLAVTVVDDGDEALALIEGGARFDALVTDIKFPGKTCGWDLARSARMRSPTIEVFYTTGHGEVEWLREGVARSVLVPKPFLPYVLASEVGAVLSPE